MHHVLPRIVSSCPVGRAPAYQSECCVLWRIYCRRAPQTRSRSIAVRRPAQLTHTELAIHAEALRIAAMNLERVAQLQVNQVFRST